MTSDRMFGGVLQSGPKKTFHGPSPALAFSAALLVLAAFSSAARAAAYVYYTDSSDESIYRANADGSSPITLFNRTGVGAGVTSIVVDTIHNKIYFTDRDNGSATAPSLGLWEGNLDGSGSLTQIANISDNYGLAIDIADGKIYESSQNSGEVFQSNLDGSDSVRILSGLSGPTYMDFSGGDLYIGSWTTTEGYKYDVADETTTRLNFGAASWGVAVDPGNDAVYGASVFNAAIYKTDLDGANEGTFASGLPYVVYLQNFDGYLYAAASGTIYKAPLGSSSFSSVFTPGGSVFAFADVNVPEPVTLMFPFAAVGYLAIRRRCRTA